MGCSFSLEHYREILEIAKSNDYAFLGFHRPYLPGRRRVIYLRHDIDICMEEAIEMAYVESKMGINATYFFLVNSPVYNPLAKDSLELIHSVQSLGHWVGLHIDPVLLLTNDIRELERQIIFLIEYFGKYIDLVRVVSFHRPSTMVLSRDFRGFVSTYAPRFFRDIKYISDSRGTWREGCPCRYLSKKTYEALQILVHPIWWKIKESETLGQTLSMLLKEREKCIRAYLAANVEPLATFLFQEEEK